MSNTAREAGPGGQLYALTTLRFFAALAVALHHMAAIAGNLVFIALCGFFGWLGVSFFFLLSGFVLMWSYNSETKPGRFIVRRLTRIYPLHLLTLLAALALFAIYHEPIGGYHGTLYGTFASVLLIHDWVPLHPEIRQAWNGVSWSLSCEFFFYLCAPFLLPLIARQSGLAFAKTALVLWLLLGGSLLLANAKGWSGFLDVFMYHPLPRLFEFCLGALGARWLQQGFRPPPVAWALVAILLPVYCYALVTGPQKSCGDIMNLLFMPGALLLILSVAAAERAGGANLLSHPWLIMLGEASFALYMIHALLLGIFAHAVLPRVAYWRGSSLYLEAGLVILYLACAIGLSIVVHLWVEIPLRQWLLRRLKVPGSMPVLPQAV